MAKKCGCKGKAHSALSYRLKTHGIDNLKKYIEQRIKLV